MYNKIIFALVAFTGVHLATTLECYSCLNDNCNNPVIDTCNTNTAQKTFQTVDQIFQNVPTERSSNFICTDMNYNITSSSNSVQYMYLRGCIWRETRPCSWETKSSFIGSTDTWKRRCSNCQTNLCNGRYLGNVGNGNGGNAGNGGNGDDGRNPAANFSTSTFTLMTTVLSVLIAKNLT